MRSCRRGPHGRARRDIRRRRGSPVGAGQEGAKKKALDGRHFLVTAGPCREPIDPVRFISNRSSGKMGFALAEAAAELGATVTLVSGPTALTPPEVVEFVSVETTDEMHEAVMGRFKKADCLIMAAAPADFTPDDVAGTKIKKQNAPSSIRLKPTTDILADAGKHKRKGQVLVGFALETDNGVDNARKKLHDKNLDVIILNSPVPGESGFDSDTNRVTIIRPRRKPQQLSLASKQDLGISIIEFVVALL